MDEFENDDIFSNCERSQSEVMKRCNFSDSHLIDARVASTNSLLYNDKNTTPSSSADTVNETDTDSNSGIKKKSYPAMLKLISGSLVGESRYADVYSKLELDGTETLPKESSSPDSETNKSTVPTLPEIARKVAAIEGKVLDEKQYITYEIISCTFLLDLIKDGCDASTKLGKYLGKTLTGSNTVNTSKLIEQLKARGGQDQLLMFLTGPAGAGKSTAVKVTNCVVYLFDS